MDAQFEGADEGKTSTNVISTRRYLCPHPDVPGYFAEVGYGEQVLPGQEPIPLEDEMKPYLQGLRFLREVDFVSYPSLRTRLVPVGYSPVHMEVQAHFVWVTGKSNWLLKLDLDSVRPLGIIWLRNAVGAIAVGADEVWLAHNEIDLRAPETFSTDSLKFLEHFSYNYDAEAAFAARAIWVPACAVGTFACFGKVARIDLDKQNTITRFKGGGGSLAAHGDTVWVLKDGKEQGVTRIDASRAATIADIHVPVTSTARLVADSHALWINDASSVWRVDAQSNQVTRIDFQGATQSCVTGDTLWILEFAQRPGAGGFSTLSLVLHRFDPQTSKEIGTSVSFTENHSARQLQLKACGYDQVWLTDKTGVLLRLDMKP